ncbi:DUF4390 domain-containing protein [Caldichromatium japonicum]|uniref:DUF4390 domain-containing protein n=1 Tax=Caldichromatium japonicum TaxID=2699430 RepID=A0A6G7VB34_9GAMM|nr:DUF4390 domain-containing protein [Caldichromatium japonicum]QIK37283.1 DUF4390 domain-containing protein [Caldichromatium japonicum]
MSPRMLLSVALLLASALSAYPLGAAQATGFSIQQVELHEQAGQILLNARTTLAFSPVALEALDHGVPLTLVFHAQLRRVGSWIWEDSLLDDQWRCIIRYRPLSERYEVYRLPGHQRQEFVTRDTAIRALSELTDQLLIARDRLDPKSDYELRLKVSLDIEELPLPLRPTAYLRPSWKLSSGWTTWPVKP